MATSNSNVEAFREWATSIGVPQDIIPSEDALKSVFNARQQEVFETLMRRVRPRQEVDNIRQKILIKEVNKLNDRVLPVSRRVFLPEKLQTYLKIKDLERKRAEIMERVAENKEEYEAVAASYKSKNIQMIYAENRNNLLQAKADILELKSKSLEKDIKYEENIKARLLLYMPVKLSAQNVSEQLVNEAIQKALTELEDFDNWATKNHGNCAELRSAKEQLWTKLRTILSNVPNFILFKRIMHLKEQQLENLRDLNKSKNGDSQSFSAKEPMNDFEKNLVKLKIDALALHVHYRKAVEERKKVEQIFCERFAMLANELRDRVAASNPNENDEHIDEVLSEYMMQRNWHTNLKIGNECIQKQIDQTRNEEIQLAQKLGIQELLLGSVKQAYIDTEAIINSIQHEMEIFRTIKMKIMYSANLLKHKHNESSFVQSSFMNNVTSSMPIVNKLNTFGTSDSFECSGMIAEGKFSSTMLDLESSEPSFVAGDTTLITLNEKRSNAPPHTLEIKSFVSMPLQNFSYFNKECALLLGVNPLVTESRNPSAILQLTPGVFLTPNAALQEVRQNIAFADLIASQSSILRFDFEMVTADISFYNQRNKAQYELMSELLDKFDLNDIRIRRSLQKCWQILDFITENPLRHYIPANVVYNYRTYEEYEAEHKTYMRMITNCNSLM